MCCTATRRSSRQTQTWIIQILKIFSEMTTKKWHHMWHLDIFFGREFLLLMQTLVLLLNRRPRSFISPPTKSSMKWIFKWLKCHYENGLEIRGMWLIKRQIAISDSETGNHCHSIDFPNELMKCALIKRVKVRHMNCGFLIFEFFPPKPPRVKSTPRIHVQIIITYYRWTYQARNFRLCESRCLSFSLRADRSHPF